MMSGHSKTYTENLKLSEACKHEVVSLSNINDALHMSKNKIKPIQVI